MTARLVAREGGMPHCGVLYVVEIMLYDVVDVHGGAVDGDRIVVAQGCPEFEQAEYGFKKDSPDYFEPGARFRLRLATKFEATASRRPRPWPKLADYDIPDDAIVYWVKHVERLDD